MIDMSHGSVLVIQFALSYDSHKNSCYYVNCTRSQMNGPGRFVFHFHWNCSANQKGLKQFAFQLKKKKFLPYNRHFFQLLDFCSLKRKSLNKNLRKSLPTQTHTQHLLLDFLSPLFNSTSNSSSSWWSKSSSRTFLSSRRPLKIKYKKKETNKPNRINWSRQI